MSNRTRTPGARRRLTALAASVLTASGMLGVGAATPAAAALPNPAFPSSIDSYARYDAEETCTPSAKPGLIALRDEILRPEFGGSMSDFGISRSCSGSSSGHEEGRAMDWMMDHRVARERANADEFIGWLLATDRHGNKHANARRLGVMYIIYNDRIWSASRASDGWRGYTHAACRGGGYCSPTLRHVDHVHLSLSWDGAYKRTSYWTAPRSASKPVSRPGTTKPAQPGVRAGSLGAYPGRGYFQIGDRNSHVLRYERRLNALGLMPARQVNGYFSKNTVRATQALERRTRIGVDGIVGPKTWSAANRAR